MMRMQFLVAGLAVVAAAAPLQAALIPGPQLPPGYSIPPPGTIGYSGRSYYGYPYGGYNYGYSSYYGGYGGVVYVAPPPPVYVPPPPPPVDPGAVVMPPPGPASDTNVAQITLNVPLDCQVWIQGVKTTQIGATRRFVSPQLEPGKTYHYDFRFTYADEGKETTKNEKIEVHAGDRKSFTIVVRPPEVMPAPAPAAK
jgi:uncharacterized protein (TIGR03000 family)